MNKSCIVCMIEQPITNFEMARHKIKSGEVHSKPREKCKACRQKEYKARMKATDGYKKHYWGMSEEKRKEYIKKRSAQNLSRENIVAERRAYNQSDRGIFFRYISECSRRTRLTRNIKMELDYDHFVKMINSSCTYCAVENCRGVDRLDSEASYTVENSAPCCRICNQMKSDRSVEDFKAHIAKIYSIFANS